MKDSDTTGRESGGGMQNLLSVSPGCGWLRCRIHPQAQVLSWLHTVHLCALPGCLSVAVFTSRTHTAELAPTSSQQHMLAQWVSKTLCQLFDGDSWDVLATTGGGENRAGWFPGLSSLLALQEVWGLAAASSITCELLQRFAIGVIKLLRLGKKFWGQTWKEG